MATIDGMYLEIDSLMANLEAAKETLLKKLVQDEILDESTATEVRDCYGFMIIKKAWYKRLFSGTGWVFSFVKLTEIQDEEAAG